MVLLSRERVLPYCFPAVSGRKSKVENHTTRKTGLARALSKLGFCSRSQAREVIRSGRVTVNGSTRTDPESRVDLPRDRIAVDREILRATSKVYLMLNKPRGLVTTASDEQGRRTVFECLAGHDLPFVSPVGRLDKASEGLLLFTNDSHWAAQITDPASGIQKTYHVQIDRLSDDKLVQEMHRGLQVENDFLAVRSASMLRQGTTNSWLEVVLDEGKNRHLRRLLSALGVDVLRLVRVAVGSIQLGDLPKGQVRALSPKEVNSLRIT